MKSKITGIKRSPLFSPNHIDNDSLIIELTGKALQEKGVQISYLNEEDCKKGGLSDKFIFSMARMESTLECLEQLENNGVTVFNSVAGVRNCQRENMMNNFYRNGILAPKFITVPTEDYNYTKDISGHFSSKKLWVKRDKHINHREDIVKIYSREEMENVLKEFLRRNILRACIMEHIDGDEIKFYAVPEANYWHWYYVNGNNDNQLNIDKLKKQVFKCAEVFDLDFYGGDVIVDKDGNIYFIDLNDWPSFAPIRHIAADKIADIIFNKMTNAIESNELKVEKDL